MNSDRTIYSAIAELARRHESGRGGRPDPTEPLTRYEHRAFSQNGEDGVLAELLARLGCETRWFVEFGIESGLEGNCVFLADVLGWSGLFVEPHDHMYALLERKYAANTAVRTVRAHVLPENVEQLFADAGVPPEPDVLSIDVDGNDYWIWAALARFKPRVVVIEYNGQWPADARWVQPFDAARTWQETTTTAPRWGHCNRWRRPRPTVSSTPS